MTLDSGVQLHLDAEAVDPGVRQIFLIDPPRHSRRLRFNVPVNDTSAEFAISNPAYAKGRRYFDTRFPRIHLQCP